MYSVCYATFVNRVAYVIGFSFRRRCCCSFFLLLFGVQQRIDIIQPFSIQMMRIFITHKHIEIGKYSCIAKKRSLWFLAGIRFEVEVESGEQYIRCANTFFNRFYFVFNDMIHNEPAKYIPFKREKETTKRERK